MASAVDTDRLATDTNGATTNPTLNLPATVNAGDLLIAAVFTRNSVMDSGPGGWISLAANVTTTAFIASPNQHWIVCKKADGSEGGGTVAWTDAASSKWAGIVWRITGAADPGVTAPEITAVADGDGDSTTPDPPNLNVTGGPKDMLFLWLGTWIGEQTTPPTGQPSGYSNPVGANTGTAGSANSNGRMGGASKQVSAASSEDPPTWTISASNPWWTFTIGIHPAVTTRQPFNPAVNFQDPGLL